MCSRRALLMRLRPRCVPPSRSHPRGDPLTTSAAQYHCGVHRPYPHPYSLLVEHRVTTYVPAGNARRPHRRYVPMVPARKPNPAVLLNANGGAHDCPATCCLSLRLTSRAHAESTKRMLACSQSLEQSARTPWPRGPLHGSLAAHRPCPAASISWCLFAYVAPFDFLHSFAEPTQDTWDGGA